jgi:hypothetical protein
MSSEEQPDVFDDQKGSFDHLSQVSAVDGEQKIVHQLWNKVKRQIGKHWPTLFRDFP